MPKRKTRVSKQGDEKRNLQIPQEKYCILSILRYLKIFLNCAVEIFRFYSGKKTRVYVHEMLGGQVYVL